MPQYVGPHLHEGDDDPTGRRLDKLETTDRQRWASIVHLQERLGKLENAVTALKGLLPKPDHLQPDLTFRMNQVEEQSRSHTRAITSLNATLESHQRQITATHEKVQVLVEVRHLEKLKTPPTPKPWQWTFPTHSGSVTALEKEVEIGQPTHLSIIDLRGDMVRLSQKAFEAMCRSYLRHKGEDV